MEKTQQAQATKKLEQELRDEKRAELDRQVSCLGTAEQNLTVVAGDGRQR